MTGSLDTDTETSLTKYKLIILLTCSGKIDAKRKSVMAPILKLKKKN
jgi:hypothetical protein